MIKKILLTCLFFGAITSLSAKGFESVSLGGSVGYSNYKTIGTEGFAQVVFSKNSLIYK
jgi:hypothetical protein